MIEQAIIQSAAGRYDTAHAPMGSFDLLARLAAAESADAACETLALFATDEGIGALIVEVSDRDTERCLRWTTLGAATLAALDASNVAGWLHTVLPHDGRPGAAVWSLQHKPGAIIPTDARVGAALRAEGIAGGVSAAMTLSGGRRAIAHILADDIAAVRLTDPVRDIFLVLASQAFLSMDRNLGAPNPAQLTRREIETLRLAAQGLQALDMATSMGVSVATIRFHLMGARRKMCVRTTSQAVAKFRGIRATM